MEHSRTFLVESLAGGRAHQGEQLKQSSSSAQVCLRGEASRHRRPGAHGALKPGSPFPSRLRFTQKGLSVRFPFRVKTPTPSAAGTPPFVLKLARLAGVTHNQGFVVATVASCGGIWWGGCEPPSPQGLIVESKIWLPTGSGTQGPGPESGRLPTPAARGQQGEAGAWGGQRPAPTGTTRWPTFPRPRSRWHGGGRKAPGQCSRRGWPARREGMSVCQGGCPGRLRPRCCREACAMYVMNMYSRHILSRAGHPSPGCGWAPSNQFKA